MPAAVNSIRAGGRGPPRPGGKRGIQLVDVHAGHRHAGRAQQLCRDRLGGLGMGMAAIPAEQAVALRPVQPYREGPAAGVVGQHHQEGEDPEAVPAQPAPALAGA